jgi:hypothetical protein
VSHKLENVFGGGTVIVSVMSDFEPGFFAHVDHRVVVRGDVRENAVELFVAPNLHETLEQLGAETLFLPTVTD